MQISNKQQIMDALEKLSEKELNLVVDRVINLDKIKAVGPPATTEEKKEDPPANTSGEVLPTE